MNSIKPHRNPELIKSITNPLADSSNKHQFATNAAARVLDDQSVIPAEIINMMHQGGAALTVGCHALARAAGWWDEFDGMPEQYQKYFIGTKIALIHSEASEAMEGNRKGLMDSHLHERPAEEVELADLVIRVFDLAGARHLDVAGAIVEKLAYNFQRADHKPEARQAEGGKAY